MLKLSTALAVIYAGVMFMGSAQPPRAVSLQVEEEAGSVAVDLVALSPVAQKLTYSVELVGASRSRTSGSTTVPAGERRVLSRMKTNYADNWCATVRVQEEAGGEYTLRAGECTDG